MLQSLLSDFKTFITLIFLSICIILIDNVGFLNLPKSAIQFITIPIQFGLYKTGNSLGNQFEFIFFARTAVNENRALKRQFADVLSENTKLKKELTEAKSILDQQKALNSQNFTMTASRPIGISRYLFIDKGKNDGIKVGQAVVYKDNYLGKIIQVSTSRSQVMLSSDPDSRISAFSSLGTGRAKGVLAGQFGSDMLLDKILHEEQIKVEDLVYTEGTEVEIPRGLVLGRVSEVLERQNEIFKQAKVKNIFNLEDLDLVFVITN